MNRGRKGDDDSAPPFPPFELANRVSRLKGSDPFDAYEERGRESREGLLGLLPTGWSFEGRRVLDFGCGAGRTLRHFLGEAASAEVWGVDIDEPSIRWLDTELAPPLHVTVGSHVPPLDFDSESFDLIWALSVFTHLTEQSAPWLVELHRMLKPDGLLIATYMGRWTSRQLADEIWDEERVGMNVLRPSNPWDSGGPLVLMSDWWVNEHWGRLFEIVDKEPNIHGQTWLLLKRREVTLNAIDVLRPGPDPREFAALRHNVVQLGHEEERIIAAHKRRLEGQTDERRRKLLPWQRRSAKT